MSALQTLASLAGKFPKRQASKWPQGRDPERYRKRMKAYMKKARASGKAW